MRVERRLLLLLLAAGAPVAGAAEAPPVAAPPTAAVDAELLEFLGEFGDAGGEFVDPFVIEAVGGELESARRAADAERKKAEQKADDDHGARPAPQATPEARPEREP